jgi:hypothetical protein
VETILGERGFPSARSARKRGLATPAAENRYRVTTELAFTSSEALSNERLTTEDACGRAFSSMALHIDETFADGYLLESKHRLGEPQHREPCLAVRPELPRSRTSRIRTASRRVPGDEP